MKKIILSHYLINKNATLRAAMSLLSSHATGLLCVTDEFSRVIGTITDGDIRNALLMHGDLNALVFKHMNASFVYAKLNASKEQVLKLLDENIKKIPILGDCGELLDIAGPEYTFNYGVAVARARAPARISFAGGGTDFSKYFLENGGMTLSATISKYANVTVLRRADTRIIVHNADTTTTSFEHYSEIVYGSKCDLVLAAIKTIKPNFGVEVFYSSDFRPGTGLGGSSSLLAAIIGSLNEITFEKLDNYAIAEHAVGVERVELGIPGGWQDQYAAVFGGINLIEFNPKNNFVTPLRLNPAVMLDLESRLFLCNTKKEHLGKKLQVQNKDNGWFSQTQAAKLKEITIAMKDGLVKGDLAEFGEMLNETWTLKREMNPKTTSDELDEIYAKAIDAGADGGRLLGTGGGGYFLFSVPPLKRGVVQRALLDYGLDLENVVFETAGLQSWTQRITLE